MSKFFEETKQGLLEAVRIKNGEIPLEEKDGMATITFVAVEAENDE
jgi:hypothetical protein